jgi:hypothetical protein
MSIAIDCAHSSTPSQGADALRTVCITRCLTDTLTDRQAGAPTITELLRPPAVLPSNQEGRPAAERTDWQSRRFSDSLRGVPSIPPTDRPRDVGGDASPVCHRSLSPAADPADSSARALPRKLTDPPCAAHMASGRPTWSSSATNEFPVALSNA